MFYIGSYIENIKKSFCMKPLGINLIVNMYHLVDLYQICSNYVPWIKNGSDPWVTCYKENIKKSSCLKPLGKHLIAGIY